MSKEKVEKVEKAACVVGRVRDCISWILAKNMLQLLELNFGCHSEFRVLYLGRVGVIFINVNQR